MVGCSHFKIQGILYMSKSINYNKQIKQYNLEMGKVVFFENYLIIEVAEGISFDYEKAKKLSELTNLHFQDRSFGYISNRVNSYSLEPIDYTRIKEVFPNLSVFAVVTYNKSQETSVKIENMFYQEGIVSFDNLKKAIKWVEKKLDNQTDI